MANKKKERINELKKIYCENLVKLIHFDKIGIVYSFLVKKGFNNINNSDENSSYNTESFESDDD